MEERKETFTYTFSPKEQEEIKKIRDKYAPPAQEESALERLRRLDAGATRGPAILALTVGIAGVLLLGIGMCCTMVPGWEAFFIPGVLVGLIGILGVIAAYPLYTRLVGRKRARLAPEILRLTEELIR